MLSITVTVSSADSQVQELCLKYWTINNNYRFTYRVADLAAAYQLPNDRAVTALVRQESYASSHCQLCGQALTLRMRYDLNQYYNPYDFRVRFLCSKCQHDMGGIPHLSAFIRPMINTQPKQAFFQKLKQCYPHVFPNISYMNLLNKEGKEIIYNTLLLCKEELKIPGSLFLELNFDYTICNQNYFPVLVIDYFDGTQKESIRDTFKRDIMSTLKMPYLHVPSDQARIFNPEFISILTGNIQSKESSQNQITIQLESKVNSYKEE